MDLWAGRATPGSSELPNVSTQDRSGIGIRGPFRAAIPESDREALVYERISATGGGRRRQLLTITQEGAGLGRIVDEVNGLPERRFTDDIIFPLGLWKEDEAREFEAIEHTLFGPARRLIRLEILGLDFKHDGVAHSLAYRLSIRDEAGRMLVCESATYSPGIGLVAFEASSGWQVQAGCSACPCPG